VIACISADVSKHAEIDAAVQKACAAHGGRVDALVASAGVARPGYVCDIDSSRLEQMINVNYLGVLHSVRAVVPAMKARGAGRLVLVSSLGGLVGTVGYAGYSPTKYAVRGLANALQMELLPHGIHTSLVCPPDVDTPQLADENRFKPAETAEIAADAGLFQPEQIADDIVSALAHWRFFVNTGFDGWLLGLISCDLSTPAHSAPRALLEIAAAGVLRFVSLGYLWSYNRICARHHRDRQVAAAKERKAA
jgi:3-dehydrosphinganine reductase